MNASDSQHMVASYRIETPLDPRVAAEAMAGEQSCGTFVAVPGETAELKARHRAEVVDVTPEPPADAPSLPGAKASAGPHHRATVRIAYPIDNFGVNLPTLVTTLLGNLFELNQFSGLKLLDVELPADYARRFALPRFGIAGTRRLAGVEHGPLIGTIIKPSVGLDARATAGLVRELAEAGIDFVKDDELQANAPHCPFEQRARAVLEAVNDVAHRTGKQVMVALNVSDSLDAMLRHAELVRELGGTCVMVSLHSVGFAAVEHLRKHAGVPIHGHRNGWGMFSRHPLLGVAYPAWQKLWRLAGVDHLHVNGLDSKFAEDNDSVVASINACLTPLARDDDRAMPVVSSGQWGGQAPETYRRTGTTDLMYLAGGGIMAHPHGPAGGVNAIRACWQAAVDGVDLDARARDDADLAATLSTFRQ